MMLTAGRGEREGIRQESELKPAQKQIIFAGENELHNV
jgi:hypothetical protein